MVSVVCAGVVTVDLVFAVSEPVQEARKYRAQASALTSGGCALNAAFAVAKLGGQALLAGAVGDDLTGQYVLRELAEEGIDTHLLLTVPGVSTSRSAVLVTPDGERTIVNHRDDRLFHGPTPAVRPFAYDAALADTRWAAMAERLLESARRAGRPAILDAEAPLESAGGALAAATHVAFSEHGLADFTGGGNGEEALCEAAHRLQSWVCVTRGHQPVLCHDGTSGIAVPAFELEAVDTLGAGDVWHGAFALALAEGREPLEAVWRANAVAALKVSAFGGRSALPGCEQLERFLDEQT